MNRFLGWLGVVSYSIYLIHIPLISLLAALLTTTANGCTCRSSRWH